MNFLLLMIVPLLGMATARAAEDVKLPDIAAEVRLPSSAPPASPAATEKGEDPFSQAVATRTVGMLRAMVRALSSALAEEEKALAAKKAVSNPPAAPPAPPWVGLPDRLDGDVYRMTVVVGPYTTRQECDDKLPEEVQKAARRYAALCLGKEDAAPAAFPADFLRRLVKAEWVEVRQYSVGPMTQLHALLEFDREAKERVVAIYHREVVAGRLRLGGVGLAALLALLAVVYGYLRTDLATQGIYRGRLRIASAMAILGIAAAAAVAV